MGQFDACLSTRCLAHARLGAPCGRGASPLRRPVHGDRASERSEPHEPLPRHGRYRGDVLGFRLSQRRHRRGLDLQGAVDAGRSLARHPARRRDAARPGRRARRHLVLLSRHHGRHQRAARRQGRQDRPAGDRRLPRHLSGRRAGAALRRADLRRDVRQAAAAGAAEPHRRGARARRLPRQRAASRSTRRRCARPCASSRRRRSSRWRCACCSRSCIRSTRRACARSSPRRCRAAASRCRPRSCRRSASTTG